MFFLLLLLLQASTSQASSETDDGPVAKLAKYTDEIANEIHQNRNHSSPPKRKSHGKSPINKSDVSITIAIYLPYRPNTKICIHSLTLYIETVVSNMQLDDGRHTKHFNKPLVDTQANGSDADSEGSDCELVPKEEEDNTANNTLIGEKTMEAMVVPLAAVVPASSSSNNDVPPTTVADYNGNPTLELSKLTLVTNGNGPCTNGTSSLPNTPLKESTPIKRQRQRRAPHSKFNRSVVNSPNCATYYFKHADTDPSDAAVTDEWSSSQEVSDSMSEQESWVYENGNDDEANANHISMNMAHLSMKVNCNDTVAVDVVDGEVNTNHTHTHHHHWLQAINF